MCFSLSRPDAHPCVVITLFRMIPVSRMFNNQSFDMLASCSHIGVCVTLPGVIPRQRWNMLECVHPAPPALLELGLRLQRDPPGPRASTSGSVLQSRPLMMCSAPSRPLVCSSLVSIPEHYEGLCKNDCC